MEKGHFITKKTMNMVQGNHQPPCQHFKSAILLCVVCFILLFFYLQMTQSSFPTYYLNLDLNLKHFTSTLKSELNLPDTIKHNKTILFWTKVYELNTFTDLNKFSVIHLDCGEYQCDLTKNRSLLPISSTILFNARYSRGKAIVPKFAL